MFRNDAWLDQVEEEVIDPDRVIIDPHHHLWDGEVNGGIELYYTLDDLWKDTGAGHNVTHTIFMECKSSYLPDGPEHLRPVGETIFVRQCALKSKQEAGRATIAALIAHADCSHAKLDETLDAHEEAGEGLFRGIRHSGSWDPEPEFLMIPPAAHEGLYAQQDFRKGVQRLGARGLTYDTWHYHHQNRDFYELAKAVPDTQMVLDHFGTPLGVGRFAEKRGEVFSAWRENVAQIAKCENVVAKLGGLAMPDNGMGWIGRAKPPTSDEFVEVQSDYYHHMIDCFGPERCMFESNFPVDRLSLGYRVLWNGLKKIAARYSEDEKEKMFSGVAKKIYSL